MFPFVQESQIRRIFGTMINQKLQDFDEDVKPLGDLMTQATIEVYNFISTRMLPTPAKIHYLFNMRDISKVRWTVTFKILQKKNKKKLPMPGIEPGPPG